MFTQGEIGQTVQFFGESLVCGRCDPPLALKVCAKAGFGVLCKGTERKGEPLRIALGQIRSTAEKADNLEQIERAVKTAADQHANVIVFPEFAMYYVVQLSAEFVSAAEPLDGPFVRRIAELARAHGITIVAGMHTPGRSGERAVNTLVAIDSAGSIVSQYEKQHLYDAFGSKESEFIEAGETPGIAQFVSDGMRVGMLTCYDLRFPEAARTHADAGTEVLLYPAAWMPGPRKEHHWKTLATARAIENTVYVVAVSQAPRSGVGGSLTIDPHGVIVGELGERPAVMTVDIEPERIAEVRRVNPSLENRRYTVQPRP